MPRSKSSRRWLERQRTDRYVQRAQQIGYRSRAAFKLLELQQKDRLLKPGMRVIDLGAAPGGWSQVAREQVGPRGEVIALDLLAMEPLPGVTIIQGDFHDQAVLDALVASVGATAKVDVALSDMAPNLTGMAAIDQPRSILMAELALDCAGQLLRPGGSLVVKSFQGEGFDALLTTVRQAFATVRIRKPLASRAQSRECYLVARGFR